MNALKQLLVQGICLQLFVELDNHVSVLVVMVSLVKFCFEVPSSTIFRSYLANVVGELLQMVDSGNCLSNMLGLHLRDGSTECSEMPSHLFLV